MSMKILNYDGKWEEQNLVFQNIDDGERFKKYSFGKYKDLYIVYNKNDDELIKRLDKYWDVIEPQIIKSLEALVKAYERYGHLKVKYFQAYAYSPDEDEVFEGEASNIFLSFSLLENTTWNFWLKDDMILNCEASF